VVANKPIGVQMYTITGWTSDDYVAYYYIYCATHRKQFHIINHLCPFAFMATVANGAVRLSIGLRLVCFTHVGLFQKRYAKTDTIK